MRLSLLKYNSFLGFLCTIPIVLLWYILIYLKTRCSMCYTVHEFKKDEGSLLLQKVRKWRKILQLTFCIEILTFLHLNYCPCVLTNSIDFVVSAPLSRNKSEPGTIYLYLGAGPMLVVDTYIQVGTYHYPHVFKLLCISQKIVGSELNGLASVISFGSSLSSGYDTDGNGYNGK